MGEDRKMYVYQKSRRIVAWKITKNSILYLVLYYLQFICLLICFAAGEHLHRKISEATSNDTLTNVFPSQRTYKTVISHLTFYFTTATFLSLLPLFSFFSCMSVKLIYFAFVLVFLYSHET